MEREAMHNERDAEQVLQKAAHLAFSNIRDIFRADGSIIPLHELPPEITAAVAALEINEFFSGDGDSRQLVRRTVKVQLHDKMKALEILGRELGLFSGPSVPSIDAGPSTSEDLQGRAKP